LITRQRIPTSHILHTRAACSPQRGSLRRGLAQAVQYQVSPVRDTLLKGLVTPAAQIRSRRRGRVDALQNQREVHEVVVQTRICVAEFRVAVPAMFGPLTVCDRALVGGREGLEPCLREEDRV